MSTERSDIRAQARPAQRWDWWPLARLLITGAVLGLAAHYWWGWTPDLSGLARKPREVFEVLSLFTLISFALAHLYVMLLAFPLYAVVTLNDAFYGASRGIFRVLFRLRSPAILTVMGLCGEVVCFGGLLCLLSRTFL